MTETDATKRPLEMPETFLPYLEKYRIYKLFKDMLQDLIINLPKDHLKHMKVFLGRHLHSSKDVGRVIILRSPELQIDMQRLARDIIKDLGYFVITRRCVMDRYEKHDKYVPGCISPVLLSEVTKMMTSKDPVPQAGWLMFDHPCTIQEARCLQQDGILPTVTLVLTPPPPAASKAVDARTPARSFFQQDFEGLKLAYKATLKEVYIESDDNPEKIVAKCSNAISAATAGAQGSGRGLHVCGAPSVYRVVLIGPRGSGRKVQAIAAAKHFDIVYYYEEIPKFSLLPLDATGSLGQEIDLSLTEKIHLKSESQTFTSINDFSNATLHEINAFQNKNNNNKNVQVDPNQTNVLNTDSDIIELNQKVHKLNLSNEPKEDNGMKKENKLNINNNNIATGVTSKKNTNPLNIVGEIIEKPEKKIDPILLNSPANISSAPPKNLNTSVQKLTQQKKQPSMNIVMIEVEKCLAEWFTLDTLIYLFGEDKLKQLVADKGQCIKDYLNNYSKSIFYNSNSYDQYQILCRKLNMLELEDRRYDAQTLSRETKPLPDYSILKEESKKMQLKVKAFLAGETVIPEVRHEETDSTNEDENTTQLPLVDKNAQNALRRRIVCQHLNKVLPDLLKSLGLLTLTISSDIRLLVNTFKLKANNIMFKPIQWTLIAIVFIRLLSIRDKRLEYLLEQPTAFRHMQLLLLSYKQDGGYLDRLISWLTDIDRLLDVNDTQLTVE